MINEHKQTYFFSILLIILGVLFDSTTTKTETDLGIILITAGIFFFIISIARNIVDKKKSSHK